MCRYHFTTFNHAKVSELSPQPCRYLKFEKFPEIVSVDLHNIKRGFLVELRKSTLSWTPPEYVLVRSRFVKKYVKNIKWFHLRLNRIIVAPTVVRPPWSWCPQGGMG